MIRPLLRPFHRVELRKPDFPHRKCVFLRGSLIVYASLMMQQMEE